MIKYTKIDSKKSKLYFHKFNPLSLILKAVYINVSVVLNV